MENIVKACVSNYRKRFSIPKNHQQEYEDKNLNKLKWILLLLSVFGFLMAIIKTAQIDTIDHYRYTVLMIYYGSYFIFCGIYSLLCFVFYKKDIPVWVKRIPIFLTFTLIFGITIFAAEVLASAENLLSLYIIICIESLITIAFLHINTVFFNTLILFVFAHLLLSHGVDLGVQLNSLILCAIICLLQHHKMRITVSNIDQNDILIEQAAKLKDQTIELEAQQQELLRLKDKLEEKIGDQETELKDKNEKLIQIQKHIIMSLSALVENRDKDTGMHVYRTSLYVKALAQEAQKQGLYPDIITDEYIELLEKAAPMHDIGKIVVSDLILKKPGRLTDSEFQEMQKHTTEGGRIIQDVLGNAESPEYLQIASEITEGHHEKWNGQGYPKGLEGEEIPLSARFMALADVFDALVSARCYKSEMTDEEAFIIIKDGLGKHFDPELTKIFLSIKDQLVEIKNKYRD